MCVQELLVGVLAIALLVEGLMIGYVVALAWAYYQRRKKLQEWEEDQVWIDPQDLPY